MRLLRPLDGVNRKKNVGHRLMETIGFRYCRLTYREQLSSRWWHTVSRLYPRERWVYDRSKGYRAWWGPR